MSKKKRLKKIKEVLLEMGAGRFFYRIERSSKTDTVEALISVLNMMGEEIEDALVHQGYVNVHSTIKHIVLMNFILDLNGRIEAVNQEVYDLLFYQPEDMIGELFGFFLDPASVLKWNKHLDDLKDKKLSDTSIDLNFIAKQGLLMPSACYINELEGRGNTNGKLLITVVKHSMSHVELEPVFLNQDAMGSAVSHSVEFDNPITPSKQKVRLTSEDIRKISELRDLMLNNLGRDFPSIKELALEIGTNTFKLKYGFKELYGVSIFRFLRHERLREAKMLVQYGDRPFKTIAHLCGFKSVTHFTRVFKEQFELTPTQLRKISKNEGL